MYQIEDLTINAEGLMRPNAQKKISSVFHIGRNFLLRKDTVPILYLFYILSPRRFPPDSSPNATRKFVPQYGRSHTHLFSFLFIHQSTTSTATKVHQEHTWSKLQPVEDHSFIQRVLKINAQILK